MSTSEVGGESTGEESEQEPAPRRRQPRGLAVRVGAALAVEVAQAAVSAWAPEWSDAAQALTAAARVAVRLRRGRGGRPRG
ncbi:hypothetical protein AB0953_29845 [Streptomyces sp. NPDC046866]|uniref:hypothetical protein n=1 Tax=Streptomyces sp. NPDC046866 TaxID=3154921 RepID=UPI003456C899